MSFLIQTIQVFTDLLITLIFIRVVLSWFVRSDQGMLMSGVIQITEPFLGPIRRAIPHLGGFDLSPIIAYFLIDFASGLLVNLLSHGL